MPPVWTCTKTALSPACASWKVARSPERCATAALIELAAWLSEHGITHVAMEATGVYWKPVWNILDDGDFAAPGIAPPGYRSEARITVGIHIALRYIYFAQNISLFFRDVSRRNVLLPGKFCSASVVDNGHILPYGCHPEEFAIPEHDCIFRYLQNKSAIHSVLSQVFDRAHDPPGQSVCY